MAYGTRSINKTVETFGMAANGDATFSGTVSAPNVPAISSGTAAPTSTPGKIGDMYVDTTNHKFYLADGASSSANWVLVN